MTTINQDTRKLSDMAEWLSVMLYVAAVRGQEMPKEIGLRLNELFQQVEMTSRCEGASQKRS